MDKKGKNKKNRRYKINDKGEIITKHNLEVCGRKNTKNLEKHCSVYADMGNLDNVKLHGNVSNSLRKKLDNLYDYDERY